MPGISHVYLPSIPSVLSSRRDSMATLPDYYRTTRVEHYGPNYRPLEKPRDLMVSLWAQASELLQVMTLLQKAFDLRLDNISCRDYSFLLVWSELLTTCTSVTYVDPSLISSKMMTLTTRISTTTMTIHFTMDPTKTSTLNPDVIIGLFGYVIFLPRSPKTTVLIYW